MKTKTKGIIIWEKIFNRIYLLSGICFFIFSLINIFLVSVGFIFGSLIGLLIIYFGIKNIKSELLN